MPTPPKLPSRSSPPKLGVAPPVLAGKSGAKAAAWRTVMVVDPDAENRKRVVALLREAAKNTAQTEGEASNRTLAVHEAENGNAAWALVEVIKPDLVVAEILIDGLSGMQLLRRLRERYAKDAPAMIFVTTMSNEVDRYWALRNGATAYIIKPFDDGFLRTRATKFFDDGDEDGFDLDANWVPDP